MKKQMLCSLRTGDEVETQAVILEITRTQFSAAHRAGEYFLRLTLGDASGQVRAVMWSPPAGGEEIKQNDVVFIRGTVTDYYGPQVVVNQVRLLDADKVNRAFFQPVAGRPMDEMVTELRSIIDEEIKNKHLKALLQAFFGEEEFFKLFKNAPAARTVHHNTVGGLLEHTLEVAALCRQMAKLYPQEINLDLLLTGALLHDIGKVEEYNLKSISFDFTDRGRLVGHISLGREMLLARLASLSDFPPALALQLEHMLLTHHGKREWGSPEVPKTIHAYALFCADLTSARLNQFKGALNKHNPAQGPWTDYDRFLERSIFAGPLNLEEED